MLSWQSIIAVFIALAASGASFDKMVPLRHKKRLHSWMIGVWLRLDSKRIPDLPSVFAAWLLRRWESHTKGRLWRLVVEYAVVGWAVLSLGAFALNLAHGNQDSITISSPLPANYHAPTFIEAVPLFHVLAYAAMVPFDLLIIIVTVWGLKIWVKGRLVFKLLATVVCTCATLILGVLCFSSIGYASGFAFNHDMIGMSYARQLEGMNSIAQFNYFSKHNSKETKNLQLSTNVVVTSVAAKCDFVGLTKQGAITLGRLVLGRKAPETSEVSIQFRDGIVSGHFSIISTSNQSKCALLLTGTVFFPALVILCALLGMIIAKVLLGVGRFSALYFIDLSTEPADNDFAPGTLLGIVFSILLTVLQSIIALLRYLGN
jgi:hypothetical protein